MPEPICEYNDSDRQIWEEELDDFVPDRVFDAHCHMFRRSQVRTNDVPAHIRDVDLSGLRQWNDIILPDRRLNYLVLGRPTDGIDVDLHNAFLAEQVAQDPGSRMNRLVTPSCKPEKIEQDIKEYGFVGLKPYRIYSNTGDIDNCRMEAFLTHEQMELADQLGLWVTMHLARPQGCADEQNLEDLREYTTKRYPGIKWILAHCARSFTYYPIQQAVERLRDMPNVWYDLSAVNTMLPFLTLFQKEDLKRIFYGSDGVNATCFHGNYATFGRYWYQVVPKEPEYSFDHTDARPILSIYEQLLGMKQAAEIAGLSKEDIEGIFWRNATEALGLKV